ncbi:MAG: NAD(P)/FAD-dependent oxidoreductase [Candidatus Omnitrophota bacterium]
MNKYDIAVVGGGASGIVAAIAAVSRGGRVILLEKNKAVARKVMISGSGRCNIFNECLNEDRYNSEARCLVKNIFSRFGKADMVRFFESLGLRLYAQEGRVFPVTNQAASVVKALEIELKRLAVPVEFDFEAIRIVVQQKGFVITASSGKNIFASRLIIAGGGKTYPALGSDGKLYDIASQFRHSIVEPVPSAVPLVVKHKLCHLLQGQKISARVRSIISDKMSIQIAGELLFTKYGLSGTAILDVSDEISIAVHRNKNQAQVSVDTVPFMESQMLKEWLCARIKRGVREADMLIGILPNKFSLVLEPIVQKKNLDVLVAALKDMRFTVSGTRGWNEAEFTCGGIDVHEINAETLESNLQKGLYFCGEILDVNGARGGYNLAWAWASGHVAGEAAAA